MNIILGIICSRVHQPEQRLHPIYFSAFSIAVTQEINMLFRDDAILVSQLSSHSIATYRLRNS